MGSVSCWAFFPISCHVGLMLPSGPSDQGAMRWDKMSVASAHPAQGTSIESLWGTGVCTTLTWALAPGVCTGT